MAVSLEVTAQVATVDSLEASEWLEWVRALRSRARRARQGSWWPLLLAALVIMASTWLYLPPPGGHLPTTVTAGEGAEGLLLSGNPLSHPLAVAVFWLAAVPAWYLACVAYYRRRGATSGYRTAVWPWCVAGSGLLCLLALSLPLSTWLPVVSRWLPWLANSDLTIRGLGPIFVIVLALPVLAWAERSVALLAACGVLAAALLTADLYDVSNLLGRSGPAVGNGANVVLVGLTFSVTSLVLRAVQRPRLPIKEEGWSLA